MRSSHMPTLFWFNRFDERLGILHPWSELVHREEVRGEDVLEFLCEDVPTKGDRLVWHDPTDEDRWREHVVVRTDERLDGRTRVYAESSICDLLADYIENRRLVLYPAEEGLKTILDSSRWAVGTVDESVTGRKSAWFYHTNCLASLRRYEELYDCDAIATFTFKDRRIENRSIDIVAEQGTDHGLRFTYGKNMTGCTRTVAEDEVYTALYGYGVGLPAVDDEGNYTGGYRRKLTFGDINDGMNWIGDDEAREIWGLWDPTHSEKLHRFGDITFSDCDNQLQLLGLTRKALRELVNPKVIYEVDGALVDGTDVPGLGDPVAVIDTTRDPAWRFRARVMKRIRIFGDAIDVHVSIGNISPTSYATTSKLSLRISELEDEAGAAGDGVAVCYTNVDALQTAAGMLPDGEIPDLATKAYVDEAIESLDDLSRQEF